MMTRSQRSVKLLVGLISAGLILSLAGCGSKANNESLSVNERVAAFKASVTGTVTLDGKPLEGARIVLRPKSKKWPSSLPSGTSDASGAFKISCVIPGGMSDAPPGQYVVLVTKVAATKDDPSASRDDAVAKAVADAKADFDAILEKKGAQEPARKLVTPAIFSDVRGNPAPLTVTIPESGGKLTIKISKDGIGQVSIE